VPDRAGRCPRSGARAGACSALHFAAAWHSTIPPRAVGGGNIDCRELVGGSVLYLPVAVPGALLSIGDGHAAQGDGEVAGTAIECGMTTELQLELVTRRPVPGVHPQTPAGQVTFGFSRDLNAAMGKAAALALPARSWTCGSPRSRTSPGAFMRCSRQARSADRNARPVPNCQRTGGDGTVVLPGRLGCGVRGSGQAAGRARRPRCGWRRRACPAGGSRAF